MSNIYSVLKTIWTYLTSLPSKGLSLTGSRGYLVEDATFIATMAVVLGLYFYFVPLWGHIIAVVFAGATAYTHLRNSDSAVTPLVSTGITTMELPNVEVSHTVTVAQVDLTPTVNQNATPAS